MESYDDFSDIDAVGASRGEVSLESPVQEQRTQPQQSALPVLAPIGTPAAPERPAPQQKISQDGTIVSSGYVYPISPTPFQGRELVQTGGVDMGAIGKPTVVPVLAAIAGAAAGGAYAGLYGAGAGLLLTGAGVNAYRFAANADPSKRTLHGTFAVLTVVAGGYLAYKAYQKKAGKENG